MLVRVLKRIYGVYKIVKVEFSKNENQFKTFKSIVSKDIIQFNRKNNYKKLMVYI